MSSSEIEYAVDFEQQRNPRIISFSRSVGINEPFHQGSYCRSGKKLKIVVVKTQKSIYSNSCSQTCQEIMCEAKRELMLFLFYLN